MRCVGVVQPKVVPGARQTVRKLNLVADIFGRDRRVRCGISIRRIVVQAVEGIVLAQISRYLNYQIGALACLQQYNFGVALD